MMTPVELGERDGRDAFLLDNKIKNPFKWNSDESNEYYIAFIKAYEEEFVESHTFKNREDE